MCGLQLSQVVADATPGAASKAAADNTPTPSAASFLRTAIWSPFLRDADGVTTIRRSRKGNDGWTTDPASRR
ncbi:hypothetical protein GCM10029964_104740 [Kibdelosporangium lantanae]